MIATLGETTGYPGLLWMKRKMEADSVGRLILQLVQLLTHWAICQFGAFLSHLTLITTTFIIAIVVNAMLMTF